MAWKEGLGHTGLLALYIAIGLILAGLALGLVGKYFPSLAGGTATPAA
jgi:hypothetical protein